MLQLTTGDVRRFREAATVLATPGEHATVDAWRASGAAAVRALFAADRLLWLLPPCRAGEATLAPTDASGAAATAGAIAGPTAPCFYGDGLPEAVVAAHETFRARAPGRPTDPDEAALVRMLAARHVLGITVWTGPQIEARFPYGPGGDLDVRRSVFLQEVNIPAGLWGCVQLGAGAPGRDALLLVGERGGASGRFSDDDALAVAGMLWPAFAAGVRAALARWGVPTPEPDRAASELGGSPLAAAPQGGVPLTAREREVAVLLAARRTNAEIAAALGVAVPTARHHVERVMSKLGVASRRDIAVAGQG